jgi:hypothetical protein
MRRLPAHSGQGRGDGECAVQEGAFGVINGIIALLESIRTREDPIRDWDERDFQYAIDNQKW